MKMITKSIATVLLCGMCMSVFADNSDSMLEVSSNAFTLIFENISDQQALGVNVDETGGPYHFFLMNDLHGFKRNKVYTMNVGVSRYPYPFKSCSLVFGIYDTPNNTVKIQIQPWSTCKSFGTVKGWVDNSEKPMYGHPIYITINK